MTAAGAMAQLGARLHGMQKVAGSSPAGSSRNFLSHRKLRESQPCRDKRSVALLDTALL